MNCAYCESEIPTRDTAYTQQGFCSAECAEEYDAEEEDYHYFGCYDDTLPGAPEYWEVL